MHPVTRREFKVVKLQKVYQLKYTGIASVIPTTILHEANEVMSLASEFMITSFTPKV